MPSISYDGQSFIADGRRLWPIGGVMDYARIPHELWRDRLSAMRQAGLNTLCTHVFWSYHEPQPGTFRFEGRADLRRFVELAAEQQLWVILRPGPYVGAGWDFGGLPPWLLERQDMKLRQGDPAYLQAAAGYLNAVMKQVQDFQATRGGPILAVQNEHHWFCHNDEQADSYLNQITRYLREAGCRVPIFNTNNLWQPVDGTLDAWSGGEEPLTISRQLGVVHPNAPRLLTDLPITRATHWGRHAPEPLTPGQAMRRLCQATAGGASIIFQPFHGGTNFGFDAGCESDDTALTTAHLPDAPLGQAGQRSEVYDAIKRFAVFLSRHPRLLSSLQVVDQHTIADTGVSVVQLNSPHGKLVIVLKSDQCKPRSTKLLTPDGRSLTVHFGHDLAAWTVLDASLDGLATLDRTNLRPWAFLDRRLLVLFGPARTEATVCIDGATLSETVPAGIKPLIVQHRELTVCICNESQIDSAYIREERLYLGINGFDAEGNPLRRGNAASYPVIEPDGTIRRERFSGAASKPTAPRLGKWRAATRETYVNGSALRFAAIAGPRALEQCATDFGYGWYRLRLQSSAAKKVNLMAPLASDRLHLYQQGKLQSVLGFGPSATSPNQPLPIQLQAGQTDLVVLADNLGRLQHGNRLDQRKGLFGHLYHVKTVRLRRAEAKTEPTPDAFALSGFIEGLRRGDTTPRPHYTWTIEHRRRTPLILTLAGERPAALVLLNEKPIALDATSGVSLRLVIEPDQLKRGKNRITMASLADPPARYNPNKVAALYEAVDTLTNKAGWAFARWQMPDEHEYDELPARSPAVPTWFAASFSIRNTEAPLFLELHGVSKGQVYLNGYNVGRYFVATATGKHVPPHRRVYLPEPWLNAEGENELILFDEHGKTPDKCKLVYGRGEPKRSSP